MSRLTPPPGSFAASTPDQFHYRGSCRYCGNVKYGTEPGRDPPGTPCGGLDCTGPRPRVLDWTLNECDPDEKVVEYGND